ncbi:MAG: UDP-N-acetylmuramate dehydrogenase [Marinospirillum sp.]|uniref:UDP-N-acetylmuramate dehydrogenase n=1 Tax=Marinospirillum sp. TaxID=2183934 RepID=UPI001A0C0DC2|nr:UDP-N-acetylmuramate dehydrogenase [Marinospirillum sp.]MBE0507371.1 UDP-N-acetylmuramate dehydrogenase [Marinospirillum sp.]
MVSEALIRQQNADLTHLNTLGFKCSAPWLVQVATADELPAVFDFAHQQDLPVFPLGGGSNVILRPALNALVLQQQPLPLDWPQDLSDQLLLRVPAGNNWHQLVMETASKGYHGLENLALIPGQAGAAPIQNIGAYGAEVADCLLAVEGWWLPEAGQPARFDVIPAADCCLGYRDSRFKRDWKGRFVITALQIQLKRSAEPRLNYGDLAERLHLRQQQQAGDLPLPQLIAETVAAIRREKLPDPAAIGNVGSFFKNPLVDHQQAQELQAAWPQLPIYPAEQGSKLAAGWLIDQCGFKGFCKGAVGVHDRQALVLVHHGGGDAEQLLALADEIVTCVQARFGVPLEREPEVVKL